MFLVLTMSSESPAPPMAAELQKGLDQCGLMLTKKNVAADENFIVEIHELFEDVCYITLHPLLVMPVCWAAVKLRPAPGKPLNEEVFDDEDEIVDAAAVIAFPECVKKMQFPTRLDISRCARISLPPKGSDKEPEDALLIYSYQAYQPNENNNGTTVVGDTMEDSVVTNGDTMKDFLAESEEIDFIMTSPTMANSSDLDLASPMSNGFSSDG